MAEKGRIIGIGGVFFKSGDPDKMQAWYARNFGFGRGEEGFALRWRSHENPAIEHQTAWSIFPRESTYFDPSPAPFMINCIVDDMDAFLAKASANGAKIDPKREDHEYGRFAWIMDPEGNRIELWEPPKK